MALPSAAAPDPAPALNDQTRLAAREFATQGADAFQRADYGRALELFKRAQALIDAPTISIYVARSLQSLGRWVEAAETYQRCASFRLDPTSPRLFTAAVRDARAELEALLPRIPRVTVRVAPGPDSGMRATVSMDGVPLAPAMIGVPFPVDPGTHEFHATSDGGAQASQTVELVAGKSSEVILPLPRGEASLATAEQRPSVALSHGEAGTKSVPGTTQRTLGFIGLGVGAAGVAAGVVSGVAASGRHADAEAQCVRFQCYEGSPGADSIRSFRTLRTVSTVSYVVGAVGIAGGAVLLLTAPRAKRAGGHVSPYLGVSTAGVWGKF